MKFLEIRKVVKNFGGFCALHNLDIDLQQAKIHGLIGPNGAGKTTLFNLISGVFSPSAGEIFFKGIRLTPLRPDQRMKLGIGRTFQNVRLFDDLTVLENIMVGSYPSIKQRKFRTLLNLNFGKTQNDEMKEKIERSLAFCGLESEAHLYPSGLSLVKQKLLEFARAMASQPSLLLLDEISAGMNWVEIEELIGLIRKVNALGITILLIEHNMRLVMEVSDVISVLSFGEKIAEGAPLEIQKDAGVIKAYLGGVDL
jgi:branched-chain amino acid transport system ATP-binding protein